MFELTKSSCLWILISQILGSLPKSECQCPYPGKPAYSQIYPRKDVYEVKDSVVYKCDPGYSIHRNGSRVCTKFGIWEGVSPICYPNAAYRSRVSLTGSSVNIASLIDGDSNTCVSHHLFGPTAEDLSWDIHLNSLTYLHSIILTPLDSKAEQIFQILIKQRLDKGVVSSSVCERIETPIANKHKFQCVLHKSVSKGILSIQPINNEFTVNLCEVEVINIPKQHPCGEAESIFNGGVFLYDRRAKYNCNIGYTLIGPWIRDCSPDGTWVDTPPMCTRNRCEYRRDDVNRIAEPDQQYHEVDSNLKLYCKEGYTLNGTYQLRCLETAIWSSEVAYCTARPCSNLEHFPHGTVEISSQIAKFRCDHGYRLDGRNVRHCAPNGEWSDENPKCIEVKCPAIPSIPYMMYRIEGPKFKEYSRIYFKCEEGFKLQGQEELTCLSTGNWSATFPYCDVLCKQPPKFPYAVITSDKLTMKTYACKSDFVVDTYVSSPELITRCQGDGTWSELVVHCIPESRKAFIEPLDANFNSLNSDPEETQSGTDYKIYLVITIVVVFIALVVILLVLGRTRYKRSKDSELCLSTTDTSHSPRGNLPPIPITRCSTKNELSVCRDDDDYDVISLGSRPDKRTADDEDFGYETVDHGCTPDVDLPDVVQVNPEEGETDVCWKECQLYKSHPIAPNSDVELSQLYAQVDKSKKTPRPPSQETPHDPDPDYADDYPIYNDIYLQ